MPAVFPYIIRFRCSRLENSKEYLLIEKTFLNYFEIEYKSN